MTENDLFDVFHQAVDSQLSMALKFGDLDKAERARSRLYRLSEQSNVRLVANTPTMGELICKSTHEGNSDDATKY